jgi:hypothetical protein
MKVAKLGIWAAMAPLLFGVLGGCATGANWDKIITSPSAEEPSVTSSDRDPLRTGVSPRGSEIPEHPIVGVEKEIDYASSVKPRPDQKEYPDAGVSTEGQSTATAGEGLFPEEKAVSGQAAETVHDYTVDENFVKQRLKLYMGKRDQWNEVAGKIIQLNLTNTWPEGWHECVQKTEMLIFGYHRLKTQLQEKGSRALPDPWDLFAKDISYIEGDCENILLGSQARFAEAAAGLASQVAGEVRRLVNEYLGNGMYSEAAAFYEAQAGIDGHVLHDKDLRKLYAEALLRSGRLDEAVGVLQELKELNGPIVNETSLVDSVHYADVLFAAGYYERAVHEYERVKNQLALLEKHEEWVSDQAEILGNNTTALLDIYSKILRFSQVSDGMYIPDEIYRGYSAIEQENQDVMLGSVRTILRDLEQAVEDNAEKQLTHAQELLQDKEFVGARRIVNELSLRGSEAVKERAMLLLEQINEAEGAEKLNLKQLQQQKIKNQLEKARHFFGIRDYDAAIAEFTQLLNTEYKGEAAAKIAQAAEMAATEMRRVAASLFVKARKATDTEEKIGFLMESKKMLYDLLKKYPGTEIIGKVQQNLQVLEEEIAKYSSTLQSEQPPPSGEDQ